VAQLQAPLADCGHVGCLVHAQRGALFSDASRRRALEQGAPLARAQAPPVKKQRTGFTDENQAWLKPTATRGAAAGPEPEAAPGADSDSGAALCMQLSPFALVG